ncbi:MAG TPA: Nudix family hydrolase [Burkholderiales bacterium]|nr:Nudix family hydrolase [Burkholderiales bacterium]
MSGVGSESAPAAVDVAAAVILRADGAFLLAQRPPGKFYAGYWEFPGGKVEPGEPVAAALRRELHEELGIDVVRAHPWITQVYTYPHARVRLHFFRVVAWRGEPHGREQQQLAWQSVGRLTVAPVLPANGPVLSALALPPVYAITDAAELGEVVFFERMASALQRGVALIQVREKQMQALALEAFAARVVELARPHHAAVLVNADAELARRIGARGVHLTSRQLAELERRPDCGLCGASCHDAAELARAVQSGVDFVVLGPVKPTLTHPGRTGLGWDAFAAMVRDYPLPVYALGGLRPGDIERAWECGAHGVAMQRAVWASD